ncbi:MAG: hypothetical protein QOI74_1087, partial [Micromonosporaceae bacterium]|nr:hypothetical protein [Micromonosporaceae bacterium]
PGTPVPGGPGHRAVRAPGVPVGLPTPPWPRRCGGPASPETPADIRRPTSGSAGVNVMVSRAHNATTSATTQAMLSGAPPSYASAISRSTASSGAHLRLNAALIDSVATTRVSPSEQSR